MRFGSLRHRITFEQVTTKSAGDLGRAVDTWEDVKTVYASFKAVNSSEMDEQEQTTSSTYLEFRIREPKDFTPTAKMRIQFQSRYYYITGLKPANSGDHYLINAVHKDNG